MQTLRPRPLLCRPAKGRLMNAEALQHAIVVVYAVVSALRLAFCVPQIAAVVVDAHGAQAILLPTWYLWCLSHLCRALRAPLSARIC